MREKAEELKSKGVNFHDLSMLFENVHETIYFDNSHYYGVGIEIFGAAVAEAFLKSMLPSLQPR